MSLDPQREARVRAMVLNPATWPGYHLSMKRIQDGRLTEFGIIGRMVKPDYIKIMPYNATGPEPLALFHSLDDLIAAGWAVD